MRTGPIALAAVALLVLAGCVPSDSHPSAVPSPSATPVFASDEDALAAAEAAYAAYLKVSDQIAQDGGENPSRIRDFVTTDRLAVELDGSNLYAKKGIHTVGSTEFDKGSLQQVIGGPGEPSVVIYVCWDATAVRIVDANGVDVTPSSRVSREALQVTLVMGGKGSLLVDSDESWPGNASC